MKKPALHQEDRDPAASEKPLRRILSRQEFPFWTAALVTGLVASVYAGVIEWAAKFSRSAQADHPFLFLILAPLCFLAAWWLVHRYAPESGGSGIPQVKAAIESSDEAGKSPHLEKLLGLRTILLKILSSTVCILGGGAVGPEGPTIQIGAGIFHQIGRRSAPRMRHRHHELWLVTGGAAGIAAAFNTPLGGLVFAIEELALPHFNRFKTSLISAVIIAGLAAQGIMGSYLYLGRPSSLKLNLWIIPWSLILGSLCGFCGAAFGELLSRLSAKRKRMTSTRALVVTSAFCGLLIACTGIFFEPGTSGPGRELLVDLLSREGTPANWRLALSRSIAPLVTCASGTAGGILAPALAAGGAIGSLLAGLVNMAYEKPFILMGMIGFLTGVTHAPFTVFILVLEMTDWQSLLLPMMLSALAASWATRAVNPKPFYDRRKADFLPGDQ